MDGIWGGLGPAAALAACVGAIRPSDRICRKVPALKAAIEDLKVGRLQAGWEKLEHYGVIKEVTDGVELRERAVEQHLEAWRVGKTLLMISPRYEEARKVAAIVRQHLKAEGAIGAEDHAVNVLRSMDLGPEACRDLLHYALGRVVGFHSRTAGEGSTRCLL